MSKCLVIDKQGREYRMRLTKTDMEIKGKPIYYTPDPGPRGWVKEVRCE